MAWSWPTIFPRSVFSNSAASLLRRVGSNVMAELVFRIVASHMPELHFPCQTSVEIDF
jgi:hypothetical protein